MKSISKKFISGLMFAVMFLFVMMVNVNADDTVSIVMVYNGINYSTIVYAPEYESIIAGNETVVFQWIKDSCSHVTFISNNTVTINSDKVKADVKNQIISGTKNINIDLGGYVNSATVPSASSASVTSEVNSTLNNQVAGVPSVNTGAADFSTMISSCSTKYRVGQDRSVNVANAARYLNGAILLPGQGMSASTQFRPRTVVNGYGLGDAITGNTHTKVVGGGICQVSSTLYMAVKNANLKVNQRHKHSEPVSYAPNGDDATVVYGLKDFSFVNNTTDTIYITVYVENNILYAKLSKNILT